MILSQKLVIMRGLPASGKTTYARAWVSEDLANRVRVNRDDIRMMLHNGLFVKGVTEQTVIQMRDQLISSALSSGMSVVSDDTNMYSHPVKELMKLAAKYSADVDIVDLSNVDVETCLYRNAVRGHTVPDIVIKDMWKRYVSVSTYPLSVPVLKNVQAFERVPYTPDTGSNPAVIFDIDGTIAHMNGRSPDDYTKVSTDTLDPVLEEIVSHYLSDGYHIIFLSGRKNECWDDTVAWLRQHLMLTCTGVYSSLYMRAAGDDRNDAIVKYELFDKHVRPYYNVRCVYDDRNRVVEMWRSIGLKCLQVAEGAF